MTMSLVEPFGEEGGHHGEKEEEEDQAEDGGAGAWPGRGETGALRGQGQRQGGLTIKQGHFTIQLSGGP